jgi:hypothetical protein
MMVRAFVAVGPPDRVRERIEPLWRFADSLCLVPPVYALSLEKVAADAEAIARTFYRNHRAAGGDQAVVVDGRCRLDVTGRRGPAACRSASAA